MLPRSHVLTFALTLLLTGAALAEDRPTTRRGEKDTIDDRPRWAEKDANASRPRWADKDGRDGRPRWAEHRDRSDDRDRPSPPGARHGRDRMRLRVGGFTFSEALEQLDLTAEQKDKLEHALRESREDRQEMPRQERQQLRRQREQIRQDIESARQRGDDQAVEQARRKLQEFNEANRERLGDVRGQIAEILSPQQLARLAYLMGPGGHFERLVIMAGQLKLTEQQQTELNAIAEKTRAAVQERMKEFAEHGPATRPQRPDEEPGPDGPRPSRPLIQAERDVMNLLNEEQKSELKRMFARRAATNVLDGMFRGLDLKADQKEKIVGIVAQEFGKLDPNAERPQMRQAMPPIRKRIVDEVLTEKQKAILAERALERRGDRDDDGPDGPGRRGRRDRD